MFNLKFSVVEPIVALKPYVRRILITIGNENTDELIPIGPTGFCYLTYSRTPIELRYHNRVILSNKKLYLAGQLKDEQPFIRANRDFFHIGLELYPQVLYYLYQIEGEHLLDNGAILEDVDPQGATKLASQIKDEADPIIVAFAMQQLLKDKLSAINLLPVIEQSLDLLYSHHGNLEIKRLAKLVSISERNLRRTFKRVIGLGPKHYSKIIQFNSVFEAINMDHEEELYNLALKYGYYDHAHFINDFRTYLGVSPQKFLKSEQDFLKDYLGVVRVS